MFAKRRLTPHVYNVLEKGAVDLSKSEFYQPSAIEDFLFVKNKPPHSDCDSVTFTTDITMLFNQQRLDKMSREALLQHFDSFSVQNSQFADLRAKLSDDQLCSIVKSRYIQTPSELMSYSQYLVDSVGFELASVAPHVDPAGDPAPVGDPASASAE